MLFNNRRMSRALSAHRFPILFINYIHISVILTVSVNAIPLLDSININIEQVTSGKDCGIITFRDPSDTSLHRQFLQIDTNQTVRLEPLSIEGFTITQAEIANGHLYLYGENETTSEQEFRVYKVAQDNTVELVHAIRNDVYRIRAVSDNLILLDKRFGYTLYRNDGGGNLVAVNEYSNVDIFAPISFTRDTLFSTRSGNRITATPIEGDMNQQRVLALGFPPFGSYSLCAPVITNMRVINGKAYCSTARICIDVEPRVPPPLEQIEYYNNHIYPNGSIVIVDQLQSENPEIHYPNVNLHNADEPEGVFDLEIYNDVLFTLQIDQNGQPEVRLWSIDGSQLNLIDRLAVDIPYLDSALNASYLTAMGDYLLVNKLFNGLDIYDLTSLQSHAQRWELMK